MLLPRGHPYTVRAPPARSAPSCRRSSSSPLSLQGLATRTFPKIDDGRQRHARPRGARQAGGSARGLPHHASGHCRAERWRVRAVPLTAAPSPHPLSNLHDLVDRIDVENGGPASGRRPAGLGGIRHRPAAVGVAGQHGRRSERRHTRLSCPRSPTDVPRPSRASRSLPATIHPSFRSRAGPFQRGSHGRNCRVIGELRSPVRFAAIAPSGGHASRHPRNRAGEMMPERSAPGWVGRTRVTRPRRPEPGIRGGTREAAGRGHELLQGRGAAVRPGVSGR